MQQKIMKYMMVFFGLMFYKVAAGLCIYFIASSLWGFAERKLLPKKKPGDRWSRCRDASRRCMQRLMQRVTEAQRQQPAGQAATRDDGDACSPAAPSRRGKKKRGKTNGRRRRRTGFLARVRAWWAEVRRQAEKK